MRKKLEARNKILHQKFVEYGRNAREWMRKCALLLPSIERERVWEKKGFRSIYEYAAKLAGMSRDKVNDSLRILEKTQDMPEMRKVIELKGIGAVKPIENLVTPETEKFWAEKAKEMSKNTLEVYAREFRKSDEFGRPRTLENDEKWQQEAISIFDVPSAPLKKIVAMELEPEVAAQLEKLAAGSDWNTLMKEFLKIREEKLAREKPEAVETDSRHIPNKIQKHVRVRTNGVCVFPGCLKSLEILHHTQRFALERIHDSDRIASLCKAHERIAHLGLIENEELEAKFWKVREEADLSSPKYGVDRLVQKYRNFSDL